MVSARAVYFPTLKAEVWCFSVLCLMFVSVRRQVASLHLSVPGSCLPSTSALIQLHTHSLISRNKAFNGYRVNTDKH